MDRLKPHFFYVLLALADGDAHGLAIAREVQALSDGQLRLWPATLYGSLDGLRSRGWIEELSDERGRPANESDRKRYYRITAAGREVLADEADRLGRLARIARARGRARAHHA